jgi:hypothetical protein
VKYGTVVIDTLTQLRITTPPLSVSVVRNKILVISGVAEPGATLNINGEYLTANIDGSFNATVYLAEGPNSIIIEVTDHAGNSITVSRVIVYEPIKPTVYAWDTLAFGLLIGIMIAIACMVFIWIITRKKVRRERAYEAELIEQLKRAQALIKKVEKKAEERKVLKDVGELKRRLERNSRR